MPQCLSKRTPDARSRFGLLLLVVFLGTTTRLSTAQENKTSPTATSDTDASSPTPKPAEQPPQATPNAPAAGHSLHGEAFNEGPRQGAYLMGGTGRVKFPVTTQSPPAQLFFEQGVGQLHGFWYWEAERSFRQAATIDPSCAMAYWGMAMANTNNNDRALKFIREAAKRKDGASRRESLYIDALSAYYEDWDKSRTSAAPRNNATGEDNSKSASNQATKASPATKNRPAGRRGRGGGGNSQNDAEKQRKQAFVKKLEAIIHEFPDDIEAKAFLAYYLWTWKSTLPIHSHQAVDSILDLVFQAEPMHPAHHYRIHLWDDEKPQRALTSAARGGQSSPAIAHMWHMPGHTYSKLHRYGDAVYQQEASARVDHTYTMRDRVMPYQIHNYAHNNEWLARNLVYVGRLDDALTLAKNMIELPRHPKLNALSNSGSAAAYGRERLFDTLVLFELWNEYIRLAATTYLAPGDSESDQVKHVRWLGAAHLASGNQIQGADQLTALEARLGKIATERDEATKKAEESTRKQNKSDADVEKAKSDARRGFDNRTSAVEKAIAHLQGLQAAAAGDHRRAVELLEKAGDIRKTHLAHAYLRAGDKEKSERLAREALDASTNQVYPLATYVEVLHGIGKPDEAKKRFEQLRTLAGGSDLKAPIFDRLTKIASSLGFSSKWQLPPQEATDVGVRPALSTLGPFRWQPLPAETWSLPNAEGRFVSLGNYSGKPVVVIFYLGYGCLHCAEQLKAFAPLTKEYEAAGIQLVAISTDSVEELQKAVEAYEASGVRGQDTGGNGKPPTNASEKSGGFPFTLLSNSDLRTFKFYRSFDDFEARPLHGTFLIDKEGLVRWQDIGPDPFKDAAFLLKEAKRLLALPRPEGVTIASH
jgi:peroxiredoxin/Tfp pilus assembly protein PilF